MRAFIFNLALLGPYSKIGPHANIVWEPRSQQSRVTLGPEAFKKLNIVSTSGSKTFIALLPLSTFSLLPFMIVSLGVEVAGNLVGFNGLGGFKTGFSPIGRSGSRILIFWMVNCPPLSAPGSQYLTPQDRLYS